MRRNLPEAEVIYMVENIKNISELRAYREKTKKDREAKKRYIALCGGTGCTASGSLSVKDAFEDEIENQGLSGKVSLMMTGCHGFCEQGPLVVIEPEGILYVNVESDDVEEILSETIANGNVIERLLFVDPETGYKIEKEMDLPFYSRQERIILHNNRLINPQSLDDYLAVDGYTALEKVLDGMSSKDVIEEVKKSQIRGRGGAGFPTGIKWEACRKSPGNMKYVVCNADEGDPGAYMDRSVLEGNPHSVIEGMMIGAYAMGASEGYIYVRAEYPLAIANLKVALEKAREMGLLGKNVLGTDFSFDVLIYKGAGAFVCGEETALLASIMGSQGEPRQRPPFPAQKGLWDCPTNINNVETWANIPFIINKGWEWFHGIGTETSKGTKIFSLVGKISNTGLVEVPMGKTLREIVYEIGGGIPNKIPFKGVQTGGPSGGCLPMDKLDLPVDFESLNAAGTIMGSGGMIVMDEDTCMVDMAKFFTAFTKDESCGKCTSCREGSYQLHEILDKICTGEGKLDDIALLKELSGYVTDTSLCGLGQTLSNPVMSTLQYFEHEYLEHIVLNKCRAGVCTSLFMAPCNNKCPAETNVPGYIQLIKEGRMFEAYDLNREANPLPAICGRVCPHPCETRCKRADSDEALAIATLKRGCADHVFNNRSEYKPKMGRISDSGKSVAVIGGGPAGLAAAYFLKRLGHGVTLYEATDRLGGMLVWGIPSYRLPRDIIEQEISDIIALGVDVKMNTTVGVDITYEEIEKDSDAIFIGTGTPKEWNMGVEGEDAKGVVSGLAFLRRIEEEGKFDVGKHVVVIGGGNSAMDAARTALRLGAKVTILYRREKSDMPALEEEIEDALTEGVELIVRGAPKRFIKDDDGKLVSIECIRMALGPYDNSGRRRPIPEDGSEFMLEADTVVVSIGQAPDVSFVPESKGLKLSRGGLVITDKYDETTSVDNIFSGGDVVTGPLTVIEAIGAAKRAAGAIDKKLMGKSRLDEILFDHSYSMELPGPYVEQHRIALEHLDVDERTKNFDEVAQPLSKEELIKEASRCLRCDIKEVSQ